MIACICFGVGEALIAVGATAAAAAAHRIICKCKCHREKKNKKVGLGHIAEDIQPKPADSHHFFLDKPRIPAILKVKSKTK